MMLVDTCDVACVKYELSKSPTTDDRQHVLPAWTIQVHYVDLNEFRPFASLDDSEQCPESAIHCSVHDLPT
jgi:hypothetical protein